MPARKIVVHRKKTVSHRKPVHRRPAPKMLPAATTTAIVNKVLLKNGIRPGTATHKKLLPSLKAFAVKHQRKIIGAGTHLGAFAAGAALAHTYKNKDKKPIGTGFARLRAATWNRIPHFLDPKVQGPTLNGKPLNNRTWFQRLRRVSLKAKTNNKGRSPNTYPGME